MGKPSREKGARGERELVALLPGAVKVSYAWKEGHDVEWGGYTVEVKRRKDGFRNLYKWLSGANLVAVRADRERWLMCMDLDTFLDLVDP